MSNLLEICEGDVISFYESLERWYWNEHGDRMLANRDQSVSVEGKVTGKAAKGRLKLERCLIRRGLVVGRVEKMTRKPENLFTTFAQLKLISKGERGKLLACSSKSTHPDAKRMYDMKPVIHKEPSFRKHATIYNDPLMRALHDDTVMERRREKAEES